MNPGDVVVLKSGGPKMAVERVEGLDAKCVWFCEGIVHTGEFPVVCLRPAKIGLKPAKA